MKSRQTGFTLIELITVIVILGILAAIALPRYADYGKQARIASLQGVQGSIHSAVAIIQGRFIALGTNTSPVNTLEGTAATAVAVDTTSPGTGVSPSGLPLAPGAAGATGAGICNAVLANGQGFTCNAGVFTITNYTPVGGNCQITYAHAVGTTTYTVTPDTGGC